MFTSAHESLFDFVNVRKSRKHKFSISLHMEVWLQAVSSNRIPVGGLQLTSKCPVQPPIEAATAYAARPYERKLTMSGRKLVSIDLDEDLVRQVDILRGTLRRGLAIETLIQRALLIGDLSVT